MLNLYMEQTIISLVTLTLVSNYTPSYMWYRVVGDFDGRYGAYDKYGEPFEDPSLHSDEYDYLMGSSKYGNKDSNEFIITPTDTAYYYVLVGDNVCPYVSSNIIRVDVMSKLPTAITPYDLQNCSKDTSDTLIFNNVAISFKIMGSLLRLQFSTPSNAFYSE